jgi:hypothetical protein
MANISIHLGRALRWIHPRPLIPLVLVLAAAGSVAAGEPEAAPPNSPAAAGRAQIEADWLVQDAKHPAGPGPAVTRESDAAGGVDGVKTGLYGFHTEAEKDPWWQVDLGQTLDLEQVVIWNRCDPGMAARNSRIQVLASGDGKNFKAIYQHDGAVFGGFPDKQPLAVPLHGTSTRFLRVALTGTSYFHLDEVEVFAAGSSENRALGKPATQSSVSQWSVAHLPSADPSARPHPTARVIERGLKLAASQRRLGAKNVDQTERVLDEISRLDAAAEMGPDARRDLYFRARWAVREMALANPLLNFDSLLFVKRAPGMFPHMSDQHYGWWSRGGGGICVLEDFKSGAPRVRCLTSDMPEGSFMGPDISSDGKKMLALPHNLC